jgi:chromosome segregation ATPase
MAVPTEQEPIERVVERVREDAEHLCRYPRLRADLDRLCAAAGKAAEAERELAMKRADFEGALSQQRYRAERLERDLAQLRAALKNSDWLRTDAQASLERQATVIAQLQAEVAQLRAELEELRSERTKLTECYAAALGKDIVECKPGAPAWSEALKAVRQLRTERDRLAEAYSQEARSVLELRAELEQAQDHSRNLIAQYAQRQQDLLELAERLEAERDTARTEAQALRARLSAAETALRPFAELKGTWSRVTTSHEDGEGSVTPGMIRAARAALAAEGEES